MKTGRFLCFQVRARTVSQVCNRALAPFSNDPKSKVLASYSFSILDNGGRRRRFSLHVIFLLMVALSRSSKFSFTTVVTKSPRTSLDGDNWSRGHGGDFEESFSFRLERRSGGNAAHSSIPVSPWAKKRASP